MLRHTENTNQYRGQEILSIIAGWTPTPHPVHRSLEAEAFEMQDMAERDYAARVVFARRSVR